MVCIITVMASPSIFGRDGSSADLKFLAWVCLFCMAYILEEQARELVTFLYRHKRNLRRSENARASLKQDWLLGRIDPGFRQWPHRRHCRHCQILVPPLRLVAGWRAPLTPSAIKLERCYRLAGRHSGLERAGWIGKVAGVGLQSALACAGIDNWILIASVIFVCSRLVRAEDPQEETSKPEMRVMVAIAASFAWLQVFLNMFVPFERFGVFVLLVNRMVLGDMTTWFVIVLPFLVGLTTSANAVSFGATEAPFVGEGGHSLAYWPYALESFFLMVTNGVTPGFRVYTYNGIDEKEDMDYPSMLTLNEAYSPQLGVWLYIFYGIFCYMVLVMLLNLLIAMMGDTCALLTIKPRRPVSSKPRGWCSSECVV